MEISLRDDERGQGLIEYLLVLVVAVAMILGGVYQLNSAFKVWAENYFGNYLACLLETGELPTIGGSPGDSGTCNQIFKAFTIADGRPQLVPGPSSESSAAKGNGSGTREEGGGRGGGASSNFQGSRAFNGSANSGAGAGGKTNKMRGSSDSTYTGSTGASEYGSGYGATNRKLSTKTKDTLDKQFAFDETSTKQKRRAVSTAAAKPKEDDAAKKARREQNRRNLASANGQDADTSFTISDFIRYLIIAAIILSLVIFVGGQMLQIGKSDNG